jgi:hypothetical protein
METFAYLQVAETYEASQSHRKATKQANNKTKSAKKKYPVAPSHQPQDDYAVILPWMP